ncbi:MAG: glycosyltransferase family 2 protein [Burkholderiales bacterium]
MIDILLATYNGERFIAEQIDSILAQSVKDWRLLIRDDGSSDASVSIIRCYAHDFPEKIFFNQDNERNLGPTQNFSRLMASATAPYVMFCDQDDIWLPDKIQKSLSKLQKMESQYGIATPLLVYTDLSVCDEHGKIVADSYWRFQRINPRVALHPAGALVQDNATGNTFIFNRALNKLAAPVPPEMIGHDWWVALIALYVGKIDYLADSTLRYRQHSANVSGQKGVDWTILLKKLPAYCLILQANQRQAGMLLRLLDSGLVKEKRKILSAFSTLAMQNLWVRCYRIIRFRYWAVLDVRILVKMFFLVFCAKKSVVITGRHS